MVISFFLDPQLGVQLDFGMGVDWICFSIFLRNQSVYAGTPNNHEREKEINGIPETLRISTSFKLSIKSADINE